MRKQTMSVVELCFYSYALTLSALLLHLGAMPATAGSVMFLAWLVWNRRPEN